MQTQQFVGFTTVAQNFSDTRLIQQCRNIRNFFVENGRVGRADDIARHNDVPQRNMPAVQKFLFSRRILGNFFTEKSADGTPETILSVAVIKFNPAALNGRKTT